MLGTNALHVCSCEFGFASYNKAKLDALISQIYFWNKTTCFRKFFCPPSVFHCTHSNGICHIGMSYRFADSL